VGAAVTAKRATPSEILQKILTEENVAVLPGITQRRFTGPPQVFTESLAEDIDLAIAVLDSTGFIFARSMRTGWHDEHHGASVWVRAPDRDGYNLACRVRDVLDAVKNRTVSLYGTDHHVNSVYRIGTVTRMGEEAERRRFEWMWRCRLVFESLETTTPG
jgi:hypothetical protein